MPTQIQSEPKYSALVEKLLEKTRSGKLQWEETALENTYIAPVMGLETFEIELVQGDGKQFSPILTALTGGVGVVLRAKDSNGNLLFEIPDAVPTSPLWELYALARRIATRVDEQIEKSLQLLNRL